MVWKFKCMVISLFSIDPEEQIYILQNSRKCSYGISYFQGCCRGGGKNVPQRYKTVSDDSIIGARAASF